MTPQDQRKLEAATEAVEALDRAAAAMKRLLNLLAEEAKGR